jgi:splicing factor 3B subunit 3
MSENWIAYTHQDHPELRTPFPRREGLPAGRGVLPLVAAMHRQKNFFFWLVQSEYGDLYKVRELDSCDTVIRRFSTSC